LGHAVQLNGKMSSDNEILQFELQKAYNEFKAHLDKYPIFEERRVVLQQEQEQEQKSLQKTLGERVNQATASTASAFRRPTGVSASNRTIASMTLPPNVMGWEIAGVSKKTKLGIIDEKSDKDKGKWGKNIKRNSTSQLIKLQEPEPLQTPKDKVIDKPSSSPKLTKNLEIVTARENAERAPHRERKDAAESSRKDLKTRNTVITPDINFSFDPELSESTTTLQPSSVRAAQKPAVLPVPKTSEKVTRAKTAIVSLLREIHSILTDLNQTVTLSEDLQTVITCVKLVKIIKEEITKSSEVMELGVHNLSHPPKSEKKNWRP